MLNLSGKNLLTWLTDAKLSFWFPSRENLQLKTDVLSSPNLYANSVVDTCSLQKCLVVAVGCGFAVFDIVTGKLLTERPNAHRLKILHLQFIKDRCVSRPDKLLQRFQEKSSYVLVSTVCEQTCLSFNFRVSNKIEMCERGPLCVSTCCLQSDLTDVQRGRRDSNLGSRAQQHERELYRQLGQSHRPLLESDVSFQCCPLCTLTA